MAACAAMTEEEIRISDGTLNLFQIEKFGRSLATKYGELSRSIVAL